MATPGSHKHNIMMSRANCAKHRLLQLALVMALVGYATVLAVVIR